MSSNWLNGKCLFEHFLKSVRPINVTPRINDTPFYGNHFSHRWKHCLSSAASLFIEGDKAFELIDRPVVIESMREIYVINNYGWSESIDVRGFKVSHTRIGGNSLYWTHEWGWINLKNQSRVYLNVWKYSHLERMAEFGFCIDLLSLNPSLGLIFFQHIYNK